MPPKRRRRFQGLYYHSSPPKVLPMNGNNFNQNGRKQRSADDCSVKLSTIRIWMHEKDIGKLTRILWAGQGNRLCQQASTNARVKRFLAAVPYVMNSIKDVHQAVVDNNLETLQAKLEPPVPPTLVTSRDANGLNLLHKAAGLGHAMILEYLVGTWPEGAYETDITGKTPLHWAASAKNNMRCYTLLTQAGCDEEAVDYKMKTPSYYRHKPNELERAFLLYVPEAPRVSPDVVTDWEALSDDCGDGSKKMEHIKKLPASNGFYERNVNDDSIENTSEVDLNDGMSTNGDKELPKDDGPVENGKESPLASPEKEPEEESAPMTVGKESAEEFNGVENEQNNTKALNDTTGEEESDADDETIENTAAVAEHKHQGNGSANNSKDVVENREEEANESETEGSNEGIQEEAQEESKGQTRAVVNRTEDVIFNVDGNEDERSHKNGEPTDYDPNDQEEKVEETDRSDDNSPGKTEVADGKHENERENTAEDESDASLENIDERDDKVTENKVETEKKPPEESGNEINDESATVLENQVIRNIEDDDKEKVNRKTEHVEKNNPNETSDTEEDEDEVQFGTL